MAVRANHLFLCVLAAADVGAGERLGMAAEAGIQNLRRSQLRKGARNGIGAAACLHVGLARPVAALAASILRRFLPRSQALVMWIAVKGSPDIGVTRPANITAYVVIRQARC